MGVHYLPSANIKEEKKNSEYSNKINYQKFHSYGYALNNNYRITTINVKLYKFCQIKYTAIPHIFGNLSNERLRRLFNEKKKEVNSNYRYIRIKGKYRQLIKLS